MEKILTCDEFRRSIYLDFEGHGPTRRGGIAPKPHMAGLFRPKNTGKSGRYSCTLFNEKWKPVTNGIRIANYNTFDGEFHELITELDHKSSRLIFWSIHEQTVLEKYLSPNLYKELLPFLYNVKKPITRYLNKNKSLKSRVDKISLSECFKALHRKRKPYPPLPLGAAESCRRIDRACQKKMKWRHFSDLQKGYARNLIAYNEGDCRSTWLLALKVGNSFNNQNKS